MIRTALTTVVMCGLFAAVVFGVAFFSSACGPVPVKTAEPLPPNTHQACMRAVRCGTFSESEFDACVNCLEHIDPIAIAKLREEYGDLPPLDQVDCRTLGWVCEEATNIAMCVTKRWYGS